MACPACAAACPVVVPARIRNVKKAAALVARFDGAPEQELELRMSGLGADAMDHLEKLLDQNDEWQAERRIAIADYTHSGGMRTRRMHEDGATSIEHVRKTELAAVPITIRHGPGEAVHMPRRGRLVLAREELVEDPPDTARRHQSRRRCRRSFFRDGFRIDLTREADRSGGVEVEILKPRPCPVHTAASLLLKVAGFCVDDGTVIAA